ncbi:hypothetical protein N658DRAFT_47590 [Parathielavia hyrcaniae]|uniref:Uncharacterized protein n=1 Tax=Parathielavia hyrcaniae TaxID=113614 RepID=A0AAN6PVL5_9PEZI|nr:hypothetical protein N658DRAFT_47590 [Parathielavia hyrcaniae]
MVEVVCDSEPPLGQAGHDGFYHVPLSWPRSRFMRSPAPAATRPREVATLPPASSKPCQPSMIHLVACAFSRPVGLARSSESAGAQYCRASDSHQFGAWLAWRARFAIRCFAFRGPGIMTIEGLGRSSESVVFIEHRSCEGWNSWPRQCKQHRRSGRTIGPKIHPSPPVKLLVPLLW